MNKKTNNSVNELKVLLNKLPIEIIEHIRKLTYKPQNKELLEDIRNYKTTLVIIKKSYTQLMIGYGLQISEHTNWLINNLTAYYNEYLPTMICYSQKYLETFRRLLLLKNVEDEEIVEYIVKLSYSDVNSEINIYWGLLTPKERNVFVNMHLIINKRI